MAKKKETEGAETQNAPIGWRAPNLARLKAPEGCTSFSYDGVELEIGKNGLVEVPFEIAAALHQHGFTGVED